MKPEPQFEDLQLQEHKKRMLEHCYETLREKQTKLRELNDLAVRLEWALQDPNKEIEIKLLEECAKALRYWINKSLPGDSDADAS